MFLEGRKVLALIICSVRSFSSIDFVYIHSVVPLCFILSKFAFSL